MLSKLEREQIRKREQAATPGEWNAEKIVYKRELDAYFEVSGPGKTDESVGYYSRELVQTIVREIKGEASILVQDEANVSFIAHARTDIPALLNSLEEAESRAEALSAELEQAKKDVAQFKADAKQPLMWCEYWRNRAMAAESQLDGTLKKLD